MGVMDAIWKALTIQVNSKHSNRYKMRLDQMKAERDRVEQRSKMEKEQQEKENQKQKEEEDDIIKQIMDQTAPIRTRDRSYSFAQEATPQFALKVSCFPFSLSFACADLLTNSPSSSFLLLLWLNIRMG